MSVPAPPWRSNPTGSTVKSPAFATVSARRTLGQHDQAVSVPSIRSQDRPLKLRVQPLASSTPPPPTPKPYTWPQPVRDYVSRSFAVDNTVEGITYKELEVTLKRIITEVAERGDLEKFDWGNHPLPQQFILQEKAKAMGIVHRTLPIHSPATPERMDGIEPSASGASSKKRKSCDGPSATTDDDKTPPWRKTNRNVFEDRITYANQGQADRVEKRQRRKLEDNLGKGSSKYQADLEKRRQRFEAGQPGLPSPHSLHSHSTPSDDGAPADRPVIGTCQELEKKYFRLTSAPKPSAVRPLDVLRRTLDLLKRKWKKEGNYSYICDQFKSLRQDLTVQWIMNEFTVDVYEIHARIALEKGDLGEYNQCQTQLRALYSQKLGGHPAEFLAYRILYFIYTCNRADLNGVLAELTLADKSQPAVKHALDVRSALALGNYHKFFRLYLEAPNMGGYLMDMFVDRERLVALANICKAYKPDVKLRFLTEELGFNTDLECLDFLEKYGAQPLVRKEDDACRLTTTGAFGLLEDARKAAFAKVDIKGQI